MYPNHLYTGQSQQQNVSYREMTLCNYFYTSMLKHECAVDTNGVINRHAKGREHRIPSKCFSIRAKIKHGENKQRIQDTNVSYVLDVVKHIAATQLLLILVYAASYN